MSAELSGRRGGPVRKLLTCKRLHKVLEDAGITWTNSMRPSGKVSREVEIHIAPFAEVVRRLDAIPGINQQSSLPNSVSR